MGSTWGAGNSCLTLIVVGFIAAAGNLFMVGMQAKDMLGR